MGHRANHPSTIRYYVRQKVDYIELDLRKGRNKIMVKHGEGLTSATTLTEFLIKTILNRALGKDLIFHPLSLEEALKLIPTSTGLWIDVKEKSTGLTAVKYCLERRFTDIVVSANYYGFLKEIKKNYSRIKTAMSVSFEPPSIDELAELALKSYANIIAIEYTYIGGELINELRRRGYEIAVWTVNNPRVARRILQLEPDYLITDRPDLVRKSLLY